MAVISIKLNIPDSILEKYEAMEGSLEKVLASRLIEAVDYGAIKPLYFNDKHRQRLDRLFGRNFSSPEDVIRTMEKYVTARIGEVDVQLSPTLLTRLKTRCFGKPFEQFLTDRVIISLEEYCGIR